jgi:hypothetical protein
VGLSSWAFIAGSISVHYAFEWLRPGVRECWILEGTFGWQAPRCRPSAGSIPLSDISALRLDISERHFTVVRRAGPHIRVPEQCVKDALKIARAIVNCQPSIELYIDGIKVASHILIEGETGH